MNKPQVREYRIRPTDALVIEIRLDKPGSIPGSVWGFYRVCDSAADAKRSLSTIMGTAENGADNG